MIEAKKHSEGTRRAEAQKRNNLGRGLSALFGDTDEDLVSPGGGGSPTGPSPEAARQPKSKLPIEFLQPGRFQPRQRFDEEAIEGLVESIREKGVLQPLLVRRVAGKGPDRYEIICGERRWRAAQRAGLHEVPVVIRELADSDALEISLIENLQREDLTPLEEAEGYRRLMEEFRHTQEDLARSLGKSRSHVANMLRLLALPKEIRELVEEGALSAGHARALLTASNAVELAREVVRKGLSVRQTEELVRKGVPAGKARSGRPPKSSGETPFKDADLVELETEVSERLGLKVTITPKGKSGVVAIEYQTLEQLDEVLRRLGGTG